MKRTFDLIIATTGLLATAPVLVVCALVIFLDDGSPILFRQQRVGKNRKTFSILKFRTMTLAQNSNSSAVTTRSDNRITKSGVVLRRFKLDELPQLINVIRGDMSLVGPRPEVPHLFAKYPLELQHIIAGMRPGITDYASIEFSNENDLLEGAVNPEATYLEQVLPEKAKYIRKYNDQQSIGTDIRLIWRTIGKIVGQK